MSGRKKNSIRLGVNIDHAATLRQVRGGTTAYPNLLDLIKEVKKAKADQITIHLREDRRHIQDRDVALISKVCFPKYKMDLNLEMAVRDEMYQIAVKYRPQWVCFVPEKREELTTEGGLDVVNDKERLLLMTEKLKKKKILVSYFIDPNIKQVEQALLCGADAVEFHTGHWVLAKGKQKEKIWNQLKAAAIKAQSLGLRVHAGHGLDYEHTRHIVRLPYLKELNIGHSIICYSLIDGIAAVTKKFKNILEKK